MAILNFREIERPTKNPKKGLESKDLDAFEKFAEEFFCQIMRAELITRMRRGPDNLLDLKIKLNNKIALVSCKHLAHTDTAISPEIECNALEAISANSCDLFIGFYSTAPSSGLISQFEGYKQNPKLSFDYEIYKNTDIESILLSLDNALGWVFTARYFPESYANLFRRFVVPIEHYKISDLQKTGKDSWQLTGPFGGIHGGKIDKNKVIRDANDSLTNAAHASFFNEAIREAINRFPRYFSYESNADTTALKLKDITPEWDQELLYDREADCNLPIIVCSIWSFWDQSKAADIYNNFQIKQSGAPPSNNHPSYIVSGLLTIGSTAKFSNGYFRELFSRLVAFCPLSLDRYYGEDKRTFEHPRGGAIEWNFERSEGLEFISSALLSRRHQH